MVDTVLIGNVEQSLWQLTVISRYLCQIQIETSFCLYKYYYYSATRPCQSLSTYVIKPGTLSGPGV